MDKIIKSGVKTSEFALVMAGQLASVIAAVGGYLDPKWAAIASAVSGGLYAISRGFAKS